MVSVCPMRSQLVPTLPSSDEGLLSYVFSRRSTPRKPGAEPHQMGSFLREGRFKLYSFIILHNSDIFLFSGRYLYLYFIYCV